MALTSLNVALPIVVAFLGQSKETTTAPARATEVWIDADVADFIVDDCLAIIQALHSSELIVRGLSVQFGNGTLEAALPIAGDIVRLFGPKGMEVHAGAASAGDLGKSTDAVRAMASELEKAPMTLIALGPATDVATLLRLYPQLHKRISQIVLVAGRRPGQKFTPDGKTVWCDYNFELDPEAMRTILDTSVPLVFAPWEVASDVWITRDDLRRLGNTSRAGLWIETISRRWIDDSEKRIHRPAFNPFDSLAVGYLTHPFLIGTSPVDAWIESGPDDVACDGAAPAKSKPYLLVRPAESSKRSVRYASRADPTFKQALLKRLARPDRVQVPSTDPIDTWLDVDAATGVGDVDDGLMMIQAFHSPEIRVRGISVVFGNTDLAKAEHVARQIVQRFGPADMPIHRGAASRAELGVETDAVRAMTAELGERLMTIVSVGPVTNVGTLLQLHPELATRITQLLVVAGRRPGQKFQVEGIKDSSKVAPPDFNFELDPAAMQVILDSGIRLVLAPWEVSSTVWISREDLADLSHRSDAGAWIDRTTQYWLDRWKGGFGVAAFNPYDTLAIGWLTHPQLIAGFDAAVTIERGPDDGASVRAVVANGAKPYLVARPAGNVMPNALYLCKADRAFKPLLLDTLAGVSNGPATTAATAGRDRTLTALAFDHGVFDRLLNRVVDADGLVNYADLKAAPTELDQYIRSLSSAKVISLGRDEQLALLINAYNAFTMKLIIEKYPIGSIKDIPEADRWKAVRWELGGRKVSLDIIEHEMIRPVFGDPRIHFALVCAGFDCPPLRAEAYVGRWLDAQLDDQARHFHNNPKWMQFDASNGTLRLSSIYKWYRQDFGAAKEDDLAHAARYAPALESYLRQREPPRVVSIEWIPYEWRLNQSVRADSTSNSPTVSMPGLAVGDPAPDVHLMAVDGRSVQLASLYRNGPIVLTFYRGGWCPICNRTLSAWAGKLDALKAAGGTFVALTPEKPELAVQTRKKSGGDYAVFSDGAFAAAKAFKVHFTVDDSTKSKYQQLGLKVADSNVSGTWELPAPATFVIDREGIIRYVFAEWDYRERADPDQVIAAVRSLRH